MVRVMINFSAINICKVLPMSAARCKHTIYEGSILQRPDTETDLPTECLRLSTIEFAQNIVTCHLYP